LLSSIIFGRTRNWKSLLIKCLPLLLSRSALRANLRCMAFLDLFELYAHYRKPCNVKRITQGLIVLMPHVGIGLVDADRPYLFASLFERDDNISPIHSRSLLLE
jgi:hypothetical protein